MSTSRFGVTSATSTHVDEQSLLNYSGVDNSDAGNWYNRNCRCGKCHIDQQAGAEDVPVDMMNSVAQFYVTTTNRGAVGANGHPDDKRLLNRMVGEMHK